MMKKSVAIAGILVFVMAAAASLPGCASKPRTIRLAMGYIPNVQFAPWYVATEKGYFRQAGLDVDMDYAKANDIMRLLAAGKLDYAIAGGDEVIVARGQGLPVTYVMALYARFPAVVVSLSESGIRRPSDLKGKTVGFPFYGTNYIAIRAIMERAGLKESEVTLMPIGYTQVASLTQHKVDAAVCFANNEPVQLRGQKIPIHVIHSYDYFDLVGHGIVVGADHIKADPKEVRAFVEATLKGMRFALGHPKEAFEICLKYAPEAGGANRDAQYQVMLESMKLWESDVTRKRGLGYSDPSAWERSAALMKQWNLIPQTVPVTDLVDNRFVQ